MKFILTGLIVVLGIVWFIRSKPIVEIDKSTDKIEIQGDYFWKAKPMNLKLINNADEKLSAKEAATGAGCLSGINAFYYDTSNKPLGWLVIDKQKLGKYYKSSLLDGVVYTNNGGFYIGKGIPATADFGHQSGPLLILDYKFQISNIDDHITDRRSVAIQTDDNQAVFAYFKEATLSELPELIVNLGRNNGFKVKNAINLDGGSSTSFWSGEANISETFLSGGWWCAFR